MWHKWFRVTLLLVFAGLVILAAVSLAEGRQSDPQSRAPRPDGLAEIPAGKVVVTYANGKLAISANNAPLGEILHAVCEKMGAALDLHSGADRRMFAIWGPGRPRDVLSSLLGDAQLDFVLVASANDPSALGRVMVFPGTKDSGAQGGLVAESEVSQPQAGTTPADAAPVVPNSGLKQLKELFAAARTEGGNSEKIVLDTQGEDGDATEGVDASAILQQVEAKLNAIESATLQTNSSRVNQQAGVPAAGNRPPGRHRR